MRVNQLYLSQVGPFDEVTLSFPEGKNSSLADVYLLTGPNGTGKSTLLYSLALLIAGLASDDLGGELLYSVYRRFRNDKSGTIAVEINDEVRACRKVDWDEVSSIPNPFGSDNLAVIGQGGNYEWYGNRAQHGPLHLYNYMTGSAVAQFSWAAFAYSGNRTNLPNGRVSAIHEIQSNPLQGSLSFEAASSSINLPLWIVNQQFKRLKAKERGNAEKAEQYTKAIVDISRVVSEITEEQFSFETSDEDNHVRVRFGNRVTEMDLLPDGLKSIIGWVGDLLMRLDRLSWKENLPVLERPFLLLLDEIDLHLHPLWQRRVLPIIQRLFPKAQIIASTRSPFIVASADDAVIYQLELNNGIASLKNFEHSLIGSSYVTVLQDIFGVISEFDVDTQRLLDGFYQEKKRILEKNTADYTGLDELAHQLMNRSEELKQIVSMELRQVKRQISQRA